MQKSQFIFFKYVRQFAKLGCGISNQTLIIVAVIFLSFGNSLAQEKPIDLIKEVVFLIVRIKSNSLKNTSKIAQEIFNIDQKNGLEIFYDLI